MTTDSHARPAASETVPPPQRRRRAGAPMILSAVLPGPVEFRRETTTPTPSGRARVAVLVELDGPRFDVVRCYEGGGPFYATASHLRRVAALLADLADDLVALEGIDHEDARNDEGDDAHGDGATS